MDQSDKFAPACPINCSGGCPVCAPEDHSGLDVYRFIVNHFKLRKKGNYDA